MKFTLERIEELERALHRVFSADAAKELLRLAKLGIAFEEERDKYRKIKRPSEETE